MSLLYRPLASPLAVPRAFKGPSEPRSFKAYIGGGSLIAEGGQGNRCARVLKRSDDGDAGDWPDCICASQAFSIFRPQYDGRLEDQLYSSIHLLVNAVQYRSVQPSMSRTKR